MKARQLESSRILGLTHQNGQNIGWSLSLDINVVHFNDFIANVNQTGTIGRTAMHNSSDNDLARLLVCLNCGALREIERDSRLMLPATTRN